MPVIVYRVVAWNEHFENNRTRELKRLTFVCVPNKQDGDGYTELVEHEKGAAHYGCWIAIVQVASKCDPRGTLLRDGARPHTAESIGRISRLSPSVIQEALDRLCDIGWLERISLDGKPVTEIPHDDAGKSQGDAGKCPLNGMELNGTEQKGNTNMAAKPPCAYSPEFDAFWSVYPRKEGKGAAWKAWPKAVAHVRAERQLSVADASALLAEIAGRFAQTPKGKDRQFCPHPATWLNERRFEDDESRWKHSGNGTASDRIGSGQVFGGDCQPSGGIVKDF